MAISWGSWKHSGGNGMRVGVDVSVSSVTSASTTVTFTYKVYTENQARYADSQTLSYSGNAGSGSTGFNNSSTGGAVLRATRTHTYTYPAGSYGTSPGTRTFTASLSGAYNGVTPSKSVTTVIPARPAALPAAVSAQFAARVSDSQVTVSWTRNATTAAPYTSIVILRATYTGSTLGPYTQIASLPGTAVNYSDTSTIANRGYQYQIRPANTRGSGPIATTGMVFTTPAPPTVATAAFAGTGGQVTLTWESNAYIDIGVTHEIDRKISAGAWATVATGLPQAMTSWIDTAPGAGVAIYRVRTRKIVESAWTESNTITTVTTPFKPTNLTPDASTVDPTENLTLAWRHSHGGDGAPQTAYEWGYSTDEGATWTTSSAITAPAQAHTITGPTGFTAGNEIMWRVRTQGVASEGFGPWSDPATIDFASRPTVTIDSPDATVGILPVELEWTYAQAEAESQTLWEARLVAPSGEVLETRSGTGPTNSVEFAAPLVSGQPFALRLRAAAASGLWSDWEYVETTVDLIPPATPILTGQYDPPTGVVVLTLTSEPPVEDETAPIDYVDVQRRIAPGDWTTIATLIPVTNSLPVITAESFEDGTGNWDSNTFFNNWGPSALKASTDDPIPPGPIDGTHHLEVEWVEPNPARNGQNIVYWLTGLDVGATYTVVMSVYNPSTANLYFDVVYQGGAPSVPVGTGWQTIARTFTASASSRWIGLFTTSPVKGEKIYIDKVGVYIGETAGYPENTPVPTTLIDTIPATSQTNDYRAIAHTRTGSLTITNPLEIEGTNRSGRHFWVFLAYGDGFNQILRFRGNPSISTSASRKRKTQELLRAGLPIGLHGLQTGYTVSVSGTLAYDPDCVDPGCSCCSPPADWKRAAHEATMVCYRDFTGDRVFGMLSESIDLTERADGATDVSFQIHEVAYTERMGVLPGFSEGV